MAALHRGSSRCCLVEWACVKLSMAEWKELSAAATVTGVHARFMFVPRSLGGGTVRLDGDSHVSPRASAGAVASGVVTRAPTRTAGGALDDSAETLKLAGAGGCAVRGTDRDTRWSTASVSRMEQGVVSRFRDRGSVAELQ